jgi:hypothetical protein
MKVIGNPAEMDDQEFLYALLQIQKALKSVQCENCDTECTLFFSMKDKSFKRMKLCCDAAKTTIPKIVAEIVAQLPKRE